METTTTASQHFSHAVTCDERAAWYTAKGMPKMALRSRSTAAAYRAAAVKLAAREAGLAASHAAYRARHGSAAQ